MKKILSLVLVLLAFEASAQGFHIIPKVGMNLSSLTNLDGSSIMGLNAGVSAEIMLSKRFAIEPGVLFSMQGTKLDGEHVKLNYINIPVYAKYYLIKGFNVFAGPQLGINVGAKKGGESIKDLVRTGDFGLGMGVGYQFQWGLMFSVNYNIGFVDIQKAATAKNGVFQVNAGWRF